MFEVFQSEESVLHQFHHHIIRILLPVVVLLAGVAGNTVVQAQSDQRCFPETNQCISGPIRAYWEHNGGLPIFGYPVTPQRIETVEGQSLPIQWFERDRLEDHGSQGVMAGRLGARYLEMTYRPWEYFDKVGSTSPPTGCQFFAQTGHTLCEPYLSYWRNNGGLERFGYPVTQPFTDWVEESKLSVQYFERRRMEVHPELPGSPILLGLLGKEVLATPEPYMAYPDCLSLVLPSLRPAIDKLHLGQPVGCPSLNPWPNTTASTQQFEHGEMIWIAERPVTLPGGGTSQSAIFAVVNGSPKGGAYSDTWSADKDPDMPNMTAPGAGLYAPWRGFGKVWAEHQDLREALGWATEPQAQAHKADVQLFTHAILTRINETGVVYAVGFPEPVQVVSP